MTQKCVWCNKENERVKEITALTKTGFGANLHERNYFVCPEHEAKFRKFNDRVIRYAILFVSLIAICFLGMVGPAIFHNYIWSRYLMVLSFACMGLVVVIFPFCSQTTFEFMSIATSIKVVRIIGGVVFALGAIGFVLGLLCG